MSIEIGLIGDVHATVGPLRDALKIFKQNSVDHILCLGDVAGYGTEIEQCIELLIGSGCTAILGNHDRWYIDRNIGGSETPIKTFFNNLPVTWKLTLEEKTIFAVHASPPYSMNRGITLLDQDGKVISGRKKQWAVELERYGFDVLAVGHTHQVFAEVLGQTLVINPGSTKFNNTCAILRLPAREVRIIPLSGATTRKVWHWGMMT